MTIRTSSQAGNWSSSSTWGGSAAPGAGDQAIVGHAVTVDVNVTVGISPPFSPNRTSGEQPTVSASAGATPTNLPTGAYRVRYTNVDSGGKESNSSVGISAVTFTNGSSTPRITLPALPTGVTSRNVYLSAAGGAAGTETLYATGVTGTTYEPVSASWTDGTTTQAAAAVLPNSAAIKINAGSLMVADNVALTARGDIFCNGFPINIGTSAGGAGLEFDASASVGTTNTYYRLLLGTDTGTTSNAILTVVGASGNRCFIRSNASGGNGSIGTVYNSTAGGNTTNSGYGSVNYCAFLRLGTSTRRAWEIQQLSGTSTISLTNNTWDACGSVYWLYAVPNTSHVTLSGNIFTNSVDATNGNFRVVVSSPSTGLRLCTNNSFDKILTFTTTDGATITGNYFGSGYSFSAGLATSFADNFCLLTSNLNTPGNVTGNYFFDPTTATNNVHFMSAPGSAIDPWLIENNIFQHGGNATIGDTGDAISGTKAGSGCTVQGNLILYGHSNNCGTGTMLTIFSQESNLGDIYVQHNTVYTSLFNLSLNEINGGTNMEAGEVRCRSNLYVKRASFGTDIRKCHTFGTLAGLPDDLLVEADYNATAGTVATGADITNGYHGKFSYTPGTHDVALADEAAVGFVDPARDLANWGATLHSTDGTNATALAVIAADPTLIPGMITWVRAGFAPTNAALQNAGHDGVTIGAVEGNFIAATSYTFTGPTSGNLNAASSNFTVTPDDDATGVVVTPATDGTGTFSPTSVTFTGSTPETFTYTPTDAAGSPHTLSVTDDSGLTDPASIDYSVTVPGSGRTGMNNRTLRPY